MKTNKTQNLTKTEQNKLPNAKYQITGIMWSISKIDKDKIIIQITYLGNAKPVSQKQNDTKPVQNPKIEPVQQTNNNTVKPIPVDSKPKIEYESPVEKATKKLQDALKKQKQANQQLKYARKRKAKILALYKKTPISDPKKAKLFVKLQKANAYLIKCLVQKVKADAYLKECIKEYEFSFRIKKLGSVQQQRTYQRAA